MPLWANLLLVVLLFCSSAFLALSEAAVVSLSKHKIKKIVVLRNHLKEFFDRWLRRPQDFMITVLIGDTLVTMFLGLTSTYLVINFLESSGVKFNRLQAEIIIWACITVIVLIFCELAPKMFGRSNPERTSIAVIRAVNAVNKLLRPVVPPWGGTVELFGGGKKPLAASRLTSMSIEDLRSAVVEVMLKTGLETETGRMLEGILDLPRMKAKDVMVPAARLNAVDISDGKEDVVERLIQAGHMRVPVYEGDKNKITGIVLLKELFNPETGAVRFSKDIIRPVITVGPRAGAGDLLREFRKGITHCAAIVNKKGVLKGVVFLEDIIKNIVGEITEEYEIAKKAAGGDLR